MVTRDFPDVCVNRHGVVVPEGEECDAVGYFASTAINFGERSDEVRLRKGCEGIHGDVIFKEVACGGDDAWGAEAKAIGAEFTLGEILELF